MRRQQERVDDVAPRSPPGVLRISTPSMKPISSPSTLATRIRSEVGRPRCPRPASGPLTAAPTRLPTAPIARGDRHADRRRRARPATTLAAMTWPRCGTSVNVISPVRWLHSLVTDRIAMTGSSSAIGKPIGRTEDVGSSRFSSGTNRMQPIVASRGDDRDAHHEPEARAGVEHLAELDLDEADQRDAGAGRVDREGGLAVLMPGRAPSGVAASRWVPAVSWRNISSRPAPSAGRSSTSATPAAAAALPTVGGVGLGAQAAVAGRSDVMPAAVSALARADGSPALTNVPAVCEQLVLGALGDDLAAGR